MRLFLVDSAVLKAEDLRFSEAGVKEMVKNVIIPLWNAYSFFVTYANIDGVVVDRQYDIGQTVAASFQAPTLFTIAEDLTKMQVQADVDQSDISRVATGQKARFTVDAFPGKTFDGNDMQRLGVANRVLPFSFTAKPPAVCQPRATPRIKNSTTPTMAMVVYWRFR